MPQVVPGEVLDLRASHRRLEHPIAEVVGAHGRLARRAGEYPPAVEPARERTQNRHGGVVKLDMTRSAVLRPWNGQDAVRQVHVLPTEVELLAASKAGVEREGGH